MKLLTMIKRVNKVLSQKEPQGLMPDAEIEFLFERQKNISIYATFLSQPLNIGMFVPAIEVDGKWEVLEMPKNFEATMKGNYFTSSKSELFLLQQYQQYKDKVLFEGFDSKKRNEYFIVSHDEIQIWLSWTDRVVNDLL